MTFAILNRKEFAQYIDEAFRYSFMQTIHMADFFEKRGNKVYFVAWKEENEILIAAILYSVSMTGGLYMELNSGPVCKDPTKLKDFYQALQEFAKSQGVLELVIKPYDVYQTFDNLGNSIDKENKSAVDLLIKIGYKHDGLKTGYPAGDPEWYYLKELNRYDADSLLKSFNKNGIRNIKAASDFNVLVRNITRKEIPLFKRIIESTGKRQGFEDKTLDYYYKLYDSFGSDAEFLVAELDIKESLKKIESKMDSINQNTNQNIQQIQSLQKKKEFLLEVENKEKSGKIVLAGALIIYTKTEATYLFGGSYIEYQKFSAAFLLQYYAMLQAIRKKISLYNFLGIQGVFDGSDGVLRFKQNFNGYIIRKTGIFRYYPIPYKYKLVRMIKRLLGRV